ncbi:hypothetical protein LTR37_019315 [Vermiconidia calcicola]|uniref:Uncharacterized protein n=1 Tax=Vermiconidia calcicola TaxID=1690605 RepID=A0ACC3MFQ4_9PEZI|nr:hypothetical protein LTR37_019315 [Vermiconidia calcicola]
MTTEIDWDESAYYQQRYPPSLDKVIMDFHRAHSNSLRLAHDVGSGSILFASRLAEYFQHVHASDRKSANIERARQRLDSWHAENWWKGKFTFSVTPAEKAHEIAALGSVDLVTLIECAPWTDQDAVVDSVAKSLAPNGTLAVDTTNPAPTVIGNELVNALVRELFDFWINALLQELHPNSTIGKRYLAQANSGVECVPLPEGKFIQDVTKRIDINTHGRGSDAHALPGHEDMALPSRAHPDHRRYEFSSEDPEGRGWRYEVEASWFRGLIGSTGKEGRLHVYESRLREIERAVTETTSTGTVMIEWTVALLLGTRK